MENSSVITDDAQGLSDILIVKNSCKPIFSSTAGSITVPLFLPADIEASWLLISRSLSCSINNDRRTRKYLFLYPQKDRLGLRKQNVNCNQNYKCH